MNFNDFLSSVVTLFALMVVNNWMEIVDLYVTKLNNNSWVRWYFVIFYYFAVVVGINVIVAFAIDMYDSVLRQDDEREESVKLLLDEIKGKTGTDNKRATFSTQYEEEKGLMDE